MVRIEDLLQLISNGAGILSLSITLIIGFFVVKSGTMKAANDAQGSAISAMRSELETLRERVEDKEKENVQLHQKIVRCEQIIDTICSALKLRGLNITIQNEIINIQDGSNSTTARISGNTTP